MAQLAARAGLWSAVVVGSVGGVVGLVRSPDAAPPPAPAVSNPTSLPASVAGTAEVAVRLWLTASADQSGELDELFVEPPAELDLHGLTVDQVTAVSGQRLEDGYWTVTVEARVVEATANDASADEATATGTTATGTSTDDPGGQDSAGQDAGATTWFVEVGVVGDDAGGLAVLTTPAILAGLPEATTGWRRGGPPPSRPGRDDPVAALVQGFLAAVLAGEGDPSRYVAPDVDLVVASPAVFQTVDVVGLSVQELSGGDLRVWAETEATTARGTRLEVAYELLVAEQADRWEVMELWGSPTVVGTPPPQPESDTEPSPPAEPATTDTNAPGPGA